MLAIIKDRRPLALCHVDELQFVLPLRLNLCIPLLTYLLILLHTNFVPT